MRRNLLFLVFVLSFCFTSGAQARKLALLVGIDEYANVPSLKCCVNDMKALKEALRTIGFEEKDVQLIVTGSGDSLSAVPTKKKIEQKVAEILAAAQPNDIVFFAFSGHGAREDKTDYFCPPFADPDNIEGTCVSITKIMDDLSKCQAKFKWMVVDACRNNPNNSRDAKAFQVIPTPPAGIALFQSCDKGEKSYEENRPGGHGYFTKNLVTALSGEADANQDGKLTLFEVCSWTAAQTQAEVEKAENKTQRPFLNLAVANFTLSEDVNVPKAKKLVEEARKAVEAENYELAVKKYDEAIALCPRYKSIKRERESARRLLNAKPKFNPMHITVPDDLPTIEEAYKNVKDGGIVTIQPGKYELSATLVVNRPVTFRGSTGRAEDIVIDCPSSHAFQITGGSPAFQNLTASSGAETRSSFNVTDRTMLDSTTLQMTQQKTYNGFYVTEGTPKLFRCILTSRLGAGMYINGEKADPQVDSCIIRNCKGGGVVVHDNGLGKFSNCEIHGNAQVGIHVDSSGDPTFIRCKIRDIKSTGIIVDQNGLGTFKDCEIYGNLYSGIQVSESGNPTFTGCIIHDNKQTGVYVLISGLGKFSNCEIYGNEMPGIEVSQSGNPTFSGCKIHDGKSVGVVVCDNGLGKSSDCEIYRNANVGIEVKTSGNPTFTGCKIHDGKSVGVYVHDKGMGTFNNNTLERNFWNGKLENWYIDSDAGKVTGSGNTPPIPAQ
ncbi:MAG: right-handed parallel beta-helix repeat-containing protein [Thermoguttaceae bacterium]|nr:right-handed parallel beta-helix repeat-containing protein [Thermoguttaceae bacterium]